MEITFASSETRQFSSFDFHEQLHSRRLLFANKPPHTEKITGPKMIYTLFFTIFIIPFCLGRVMNNPPNQDLSRDKNVSTK
ncbi:hypothetical protein CEXT_367301 [Caerostris extrusa]|uniref:Transmembrane protein n=1 Tax=Caerostris extrusa TaxID=172846 RepID=A0AAV4UE61_CAEEX|nr:hypothetical protein CEXT_367301 [Caerostris extrusa]